jgi:formamidopyrimidine-DNA glycosylase
MPELPEVETIAAALRMGTENLSLVGQKIEKVRVDWPRHIAIPSVRLFKKKVIGRTVTGVSRRGKFLLLELDLGTILIHLRMSGDLYLRPMDAPKGRFEHTVFHLEDGTTLRFSDARKFGKVYWVIDPQPMLAELGPEPLDPTFTEERFMDMLSSRKRQLKPLLMDQKFMVGLGNIYTDEALHLARIHPQRQSHSLNSNEVKVLLRAIRSTLTNGIRNNGASIDWVYRGGNFQNLFRVYQKTGEPCPDCGTMIKRIVVGQRGTHYCPTCQPEALL